MKPVQCIPGMTWLNSEAQRLGVSKPTIRKWIRAGLYGRVSWSRKGANMVVQATEALPQLVIKMQQWLIQESDRTGVFTMTIYRDFWAGKYPHVTALHVGKGGRVDWLVVNEVKAEAKAA